MTEVFGDSWRVLKERNYRRLVSARNREISSRNLDIGEDNRVLRRIIATEIDKDPDGDTLTIKFRGREITFPDYWDVIGEERKFMITRCAVGIVKEIGKKFVDNKRPHLRHRPYTEKEIRCISHRGKFGGVLQRGNVQRPGRTAMDFRTFYSFAYPASLRLHNELCKLRLYLQRKCAWLATKSKSSTKIERETRDLIKMSRRFRDAVGTHDMDDKKLPYLDELISLRKILHARRAALRRINGTRITHPSIRCSHETERA